MKIQIRKEKTRRQGSKRRKNIRASEQDMRLIKMLICTLMMMMMMIKRRR